MALAKIIESKNGDDLFSRENRYILAEYNGKNYRVNVLRGRQVKMAFASRSQRGYKWHLIVVDLSAQKQLFNGYCTKNIGVDAALKTAGVIQ